MGTMTKPQFKGKRYRLDRPELLAPAGNLEKLKFAVHYGADAVYIGGQKYGLRSGADNFTFEEMREGVEFAKKYGAKVFVATNIYAHNEDVAGIEEYLRNLYEAGIAAIIVADPVIVDTALRLVPGLEVHLSTQQSTLNWQAVSYWKEEGLPRVVLGRETSLEEIAEIKQHVDIEIESFIHGAMCSSYSGRCVLSNHFTDRDSNRGAAANPAAGSMICSKMPVPKGTGYPKRSKLRRLRPCSPELPSCRCISPRTTRSLWDRKTCVCWRVFPT